MLSNAVIMRRALESGLVIPAFNVPYLPMVEPVIAALRDEDAFGFIATRGWNGSSSMRAGWRPS